MHPTGGKNCARAAREVLSVTFRRITDNPSAEIRARTDNMAPIRSDRLLRALPTRNGRLFHPKPSPLQPRCSREQAAAQCR